MALNDVASKLAAFYKKLEDRKFNEERFYIKARLEEKLDEIEKAIIPLEKQEEKSEKEKQCLKEIKIGVDRLRSLGNKLEEKFSIFVIGDGNVGKSTVFNGLTGMKQHTGNWPGKTVSSARRTCRTGKNEIELVDIPGTYSLMTCSKEEEVARDYLMSGDARAAIVVCDATCIERNLNLALQIMEVCPSNTMCKPYGRGKKEGNRN